MPISQVRLQETYAPNRPRPDSRSAISAASTSVAPAVSSGCSIPRSPAKPQHPHDVGTTASWAAACATATRRSEEHTSELQSRGHLVCRLLLEKKRTRTETTGH